MATTAHPAPPDAERGHAARWITDYCARTRGGDVLCAAQGTERAAWHAMFEELAGRSGDDLAAARERLQRQAEDLGTGFRIAGEEEERPWPLSPVPLLIEADEWHEIAAGVVQRARLMESVIADIHGAGQVVAGGLLPAAVVTGSPHFVRPLIGVKPPGDRFLHVFAADLGRGPTGEWRVLADHPRMPTGVGYALDNRLALARMLGGLQARLNIQRHAPFFAALRAGIGAACRRSDPRIALLTPGRYNPSYSEQAHLARYLGLLLVEGADLAVHDDTLFVRTIAGLKRIDAIWRRIDPRWLDPLAFDSHSKIGVAGLFDAYASGNTVIANAPGTGVLESGALAAFLPRIANRLLGEDLRLPNIATWWCGQPREAQAVIDNLDAMVIAPAFGVAPLGLPDGRPVLAATLDPPARARLLDDMARRPQDYVGQEVVRLSTMPVVTDGGLEARPFTLRVFAARDADGAWSVLPGGFARIGSDADPRAPLLGEGVWSADACVFGRQRVAPITLLPSDDAVRIRRNPGTLPSRVADNLFWLGRYLERAEGLLAAVRVVAGTSLEADAGVALDPATLNRLAGYLTLSGEMLPGGAPSRADLVQRARRAFEEAGHPGSVRSLAVAAARIGGGSRERLSADMERLLDAPFPMRGSLAERAATMQRRLMAMAGLSAEHMGRTDAWRFHDLGRRLERATGTARLLATFADSDATSDDLTLLLDLADSQISYRQRYPTGLARLPAIDLVALDPGNPRGIAYQVEAIDHHLARLPVLLDDGMAELQQARAGELAGHVRTARAGSLGVPGFRAIERRLGALSDAVAQRYFLQGSEPLRQAGLTLA